MTKPPYKIPSTAEIMKLRGTNGRRVISTFSGTGGSSLGLTWAGFDVRLAVDTDPEAHESYEANFTTPVAKASVRELTGARLRELAGIGPDDELDLFEGSPPCPQFSTAGKLEADWGKELKHAGITQRVDDLFDEFIRLTGELRPRCFIAENVTGLVKGVSRGKFRQIMADFRALGYVVESRILDAQWMGAPQARERVIIQGMREDLGVAPAWPDPLPYNYTLGDALPYLEKPNARDPIKPTPAERKMLDFKRYAIYPYWQRLEVGESPRSHNFGLIKCNPAKAAPTILKSSGDYSGLAGPVHPYEPRAFSTAELKRVCGFPDDFNLSDDRKEAVSRLGNSVLPPMYEQLGRAIAARLDSLD